METIKAIPDDYRAVTPYLNVRDAALAIEFYRDAFDASECMRLPGPNDTIDATFARAVHAGARVTAPVACMYWGDRFGRVIDPFGITWGIATHVEGVPLAEMQRRAQAAASA